MTNYVGEDGYLRLMESILSHGARRQDRTGTGTYEIFDATVEYNLTEGFPLFTTKKVHWKSIVVELLWMLQGVSNIRWMQEQGVSIWDEWADEEGFVGPIYGVQWRRWMNVMGEQTDQISELMANLNNDPWSRRHVITAWNPGEIKYMALPPCHAFAQFYVESDNRLSCKLTQRSADMFLGVPFNVASYSLLTTILAETLGFKPGRFIHSLGSAHVYSNHVEQVLKQVRRTVYEPPALKIEWAQAKARPGHLVMPTEEHPGLPNFEFQDFTLHDYQHHEAIKGEVSV